MALFTEKTRTKQTDMAVAASEWLPPTSPRGIASWMSPAPKAKETTINEYWEKILQSQLLEPIHLAIAESEAISTITDDWDGEGAIGYTNQAVQRATSLLERLAEDILVAFGRVLPTPHISPADKGSIDLYWTSETRNLLINIPEESVITFFGENSDGNTVGGVIVPDKPRSDLGAWLVMN